jgi:hypothetical protein
MATGRWRGAYPIWGLRCNGFLTDAEHDGRPLHPPIAAALRTVLQAQGTRHFAAGRPADVALPETRNGRAPAPHHVFVTRLGSAARFVRARIKRPHGSHYRRSGSTPARISATPNPASVRPVPSSLANFLTRPTLPG